MMRRLEERFFVTLMVLSLSMVAGSLMVLLGVVAFRGMASISWEMVSRTPEAGFLVGGGGGILNAIVGSLLMASGATALGFLLSLGTSLFLLRDHSGPRSAEVVRSILDVLWGIPSIVYGLFTFALMTTLGIGTSLLAGTIALTFLMVPIMTRGLDESLRAVPRELSETSYGLGADRSQTALKVVLRQAAPGAISAVLLAFGRGIGDAASVLYTAGFADQVPTSLMDSAASLPAMVFYLSTSALPEVRERAYAAAFVLMTLVLAVSAVSRYLTGRSGRNALK
jgi:phosphate transport system permease protein